MKQTRVVFPLLVFSSYTCCCVITIWGKYVARKQNTHIQPI